jgi:hypothetical protein
MVCFWTFTSTHDPDVGSDTYAHIRRDTHALHYNTVHCIALHDITSHRTTQFNSTQLNTTCIIRYGSMCIYIYSLMCAHMQMEHLCLTTPQFRLVCYLCYYIVIIHGLCIYIYIDKYVCLYIYIHTWKEWWSMSMISFHFSSRFLRDRHFQARSSRFHIACARCVGINFTTPWNEHQVDFPK